MATSIPTGSIDPVVFYGDGRDDFNLPSAAMQSGAAPAPDADEYTFPGAYGEGQAVSGAQHMPNATQAPSTGVAGSGGDGSTGIVGQVIN
jgi:hypothetical protein